jgi:hypothetical protein
MDTSYRAEHGIEHSGSIKCGENSWAAAQLATSQWTLSSVKLVA